MIAAHKVSYSSKKRTILSGIDMELAYGELLVIVGPNGAGKSTLLNILANELAKNQEAVFFKEKAYKEWNVHTLSQHKAKFSQHHSNDIPLPVHDVVLMGRYPYFNAIPEEKDLTAVALSMQEMDVWHLKDRNYNTLSGGERQRVHLARVMAQLQNNNNHRLMFLDEPLNNLDVKHQHNVLESIKTFSKDGNAAIVVLHDLNLAAQFADKVLLMKNGSVFAKGLPSEVFKRDIISKAYNFPCFVCPNPLNNFPLIVFGKDNRNTPKKEFTSLFKNE